MWRVVRFLDASGVGFGSKQSEAIKEVEKPYASGSLFIPKHDIH